MEKPADPPGTLASMGIYVFGLKTLGQMLTEDAKKRDSSHDFGKDILPRMVGGGMRVFAYPFEGYWVDVGTIEAYWQTHMDLLKHPPPLDLNDRRWMVHTQLGGAPARHDPGRRDRQGQHDHRRLRISPARGSRAACSLRASASARTPSSATRSS